MLQDIPFGEIDVRALAERQGPERAFLSVYLSGPGAWASLAGRLRRLRTLLEHEPAELEHYEQNLKLVEAFLESHPLKARGICIFACWAADYLEAFPLDQKVPDLLWVDSSPYIRPLAELQDEYETFVVVLANNTDAHVFLVTSAHPDETARVKGDVKNHVKVGGWSQKRYERRREKQLHRYADEVSDVLAELDRTESFDRILLLGSPETTREIEEVLPAPIAEKVVGRESVDVHQEEALWREAFALFFEDERADEVALWERIRSEALGKGRAALGPEEVLRAAAVGRVNRILVTRDAQIDGVRCRSCENLSAGDRTTCPVCAAEDTFHVDLVNELVELAASTGATVEFSDPLDELKAHGDVAALLRY